MIEFELRSLPGVVAASVDDSGVALLVYPDVDADALRVVVAAILAAHGAERSIRILGGMVSPAVGHGRGRRVAIGTIGAIGGIGMVAGAAGVAAMTGALPIGSDAAPQVATPTIVTAAPLPSARHSTTDITVVPGKEPEWAADEGPWPLPAALPTATVAVPAPVVIPIQAAATPAVDPAPAPTEIAPPPAEIAPPPDKQPQEVTGTGPTLPASVDTPQSECDVARTDTDTDTDDDRSAGSDEDDAQHGRGADRRHFGWTNGPAHASANSSAGSAPRGGRS